MQALLSLFRNSTEVSRKCDSMSVRRHLVRKSERIEKGIETLAVDRRLLAHLSHHDDLECRVERVDG